jgi:hypothetical protein
MTLDPTEYQVTVKLAVYSAPSMTEQQHLTRLDRVGGKLATYGATLSGYAATADSAQAVEILMTYEASGVAEAVGEALAAAVEALSSEGYGVGFQAALVQTPSEWARANDIDPKG